VVEDARVRILGILALAVTALVPASPAHAGTCSDQPGTGPSACARIGVAVRTTPTAGERARIIVAVRTTPDTDAGRVQVVLRSAGGSRTYRAPWEGHRLVIRTRPLEAGRYQVLAMYVPPRGSEIRRTGDSTMLRVRR
jgi:hypothetical protein